MAKRNYLEVDPKQSIFARLIDSSEEKSELEKDWPVVDSESEIPDVCNLFGIPSNVKTIRPNQGLCVKAKTDLDEKVFINICHHSDLPQPSTIVNIEEIMNYDGESLFHFPLSLGEVRVEKDKSGNNCKCLDVVINSIYYHSEILKKTQRDFILNLVVSSLKQKYNITVDIESYRILTKRYHCKMHDHFIKVEPQTNEKILCLAENTFMDDTAVSDSKESIISSLIDSSALYNDVKQNNVTEFSKARIYEDEEMSGMEKICNLFDSATIMRIKPLPGLCAKTVTDNGKKIFINMCHHNAVPPPPSSMSIEAILKKESPIQFSLSLGDLRIEKDNAGKECLCYDVVVNSDYYHNEISKIENTRGYFFILACIGLGQNHDITVDIGALKTLTKPYHGKVIDHVLRYVDQPETDTKSSFDESRSKDDIVMPVKNSSQLIPSPSPKITDYEMYPKLFGKVNVVIFQGSVTGISNKADLDVYLTKHELTVQDKKGNYLVKVPLDLPIAPHKTLCNLWNNRLTIAMPLE